MISKRFTSQVRTLEAMRTQACVHCPSAVTTHRQYPCANPLRATDVEMKAQSEFFLASFIEDKPPSEAARL